MARNYFVLGNEGQGNTTEEPKQETRFRILIELALCGLIIAGRTWGVLPISSTPYLLLFAWWSLAQRSLTWSSLGLAIPRRFALILAAGCLSGVALMLWGHFVQEPFFDRLMGQSQDLSQFEDLPGNVAFLIIMLVLNWTLAAFGEEMVYRGYLFNRFVDLFGSSRVAAGMALVSSSVFFSIGHIWQGVSGVLDSFFMGVLYGLLYLVFKRSLWVPVVAHGVNNTIGFFLLFYGYGL